MIASHPKSGASAKASPGKVEARSQGRCNDQAPRAAVGTFPYDHRTVAEVDADNAAVAKVLRECGR